METNLLKILEYRKNMLSSPTKAERCFLKQFKELYSNYRSFVQHIFVDTYHLNKYYILDYYIPELRLVFEIDGKHHLEEPQKTYDLKRIKALEQRNIQVKRVPNKVVLDTLLCRAIIRQTMKDRKRELAIKEKPNEELVEEYLKQGGKIREMPRNQGTPNLVPTLVFI